MKNRVISLMVAMCVAMFAAMTVQAKDVPALKAQQVDPAVIADSIEAEQAAAQALVDQVDIGKTMFKQTFTPTETVAMMNVWQSSQFLSLDAGSGSVTLVHGQLLQMSNGLKMALVDDVLERGVFVNLSGQSAFIRFADGTIEEIFPKETVGVDGGIKGSSTQFENTVNTGTTNNAQPPKTRRCNVTCSMPNFYACCIYGAEGRNDRCRCRRQNDNGDDCDGGGQGSPSCSTLEPIIVPQPNQ